MTAEAPEGQPVSALLDTLLQLERKHRTLLVGIDGCGGSGKSTLAHALAAATTTKSVVVVPMDDFYRPSEERSLTPTQALGASFDWPRLRDQVLAPIARHENTRYQRYDWDSDRLANWLPIPTGGTVIVEGVYSTRTGLRNFYDFTIWVEATPEVRLARGVARDGESSRNRWVNGWMVEEARYLEAERPASSADLIVDGSAELDVKTRFKVLRRSSRY
jgi:uridine kinase